MAQVASWRRRDEQQPAVQGCPLKVLLASASVQNNEDLTQDTIQKAILGATLELPDVQSTLRFKMSFSYLSHDDLI